MKRIVILITALAALTFTGCSPRHATDGTDPLQSDGDLEITRQIRQTLLEPNQLSLDAKNVTIVASAGHVELIGVVTSDDERREVLRIARAFAGDSRVSEDLEIRPD
jgi:osmotically-inducible protein OsmY